MSTTPYDAIGGAEVVRRVVDRFYDLMDSDPAYAELRALHADDLAPVRESLTGFLCGWLGGPRDWFTARPGVCVMSAHASIPVTPLTAAQWIAAMGQALRETEVEPALVSRIDEAFTRMAATMARRAA